MSVISESVSHCTLVSAVSNWNIQSDGLDIRAADTPMPRERISEETMQLLSEARAKLTDNPAPAQPKSKKRKKLGQDVPSTSVAPDRDNYPVESKPIYLRLKTNQRKKISLASVINRMHSELLKGVFPTCVQFKFNINSTRSEAVRKTWDQTIRECKEKMTKALLNDMFTKYSTLKGQISRDYDQLALILNEDQIKEIKDSLRKRDVGMAPVLEHRTKRQYEPPKPSNQRNRKFIAPKYRKQGQQRPRKQTNEQELQSFVKQLKKMLQ